MRRTSCAELRTNSPRFLSTAHPQWVTLNLFITLHMKPARLVVLQTNTSRKKKKSRNISSDEYLAQHSLLRGELLAVPKGSRRAAQRAQNQKHSSGPGTSPLLYLEQAGCSERSCWLRIGSNGAWCEPSTGLARQQLCTEPSLGLRRGTPGFWAAHAGAEGHTVTSPPSQGGPQKAQLCSPMCCSLAGRPQPGDKT